MLIGVGPGHPGLATVHAIDAIKGAEVIRTCDGCGTGLLHLAAPSADIAAFASSDELVKFARGGKKVSVLFPGNPYAFSNGAEIASRLERAGVDFEAVPGMAGGVAAPGVGGIPPTLQGGAVLGGVWAVQGGAAFARQRRPRGGGTGKYEA